VIFYPTWIIHGNNGKSYLDIKKRFIELSKSQTPDLPEFQILFDKSVLRMTMELQGSSVHKITIALHDRLCSNLFIEYPEVWGVFLVPSPNGEKVRIELYTTTFTKFLKCKANILKGLSESEINFVDFVKIEEKFEFEESGDNASDGQSISIFHSLQCNLA
jgi:hypothetical protein